MGRDFEQHRAAEVPATPEQVWEAIATGPGIDSWFMGRSEVVPGDGGVVRTEFGGYTPESRVTGWEPLRRLAHGEGPAEDGRSIAYEFLIEGRTGSTLLRLAVSGFIPGDDWEDEFDAMTKGGQMFFRTLVEYLSHFAGRTATPITAFGPPVADWDHAWATLRGTLGLTDPVREGDQVRFAPAELPPVDGVVYAVNPHTLGIRTNDALYRFLQGFDGPMIASHHIFSPVDRDRTEQSWVDWLARCLSAPRES